MESHIDQKLKINFRAGIDRLGHHVPDGTPKPRRTRINNHKALLDKSIEVFDQAARDLYNKSPNRFARRV